MYCQQGESEKLKQNLENISVVQVRQSKDTLIHVFIDEIPFSAFLDDNGKK